MSSQKSVFTKKGTELPLLDLKSKKYLMGVYRLQWLNEDCESFTIDSRIIEMSDSHAVCEATVTILDKETGKVLKRATAYKREDKKDFPDFLEKGNSASIFRCLAMLGFGTAQSLTDLDEGHRIVDTPLVVPPKTLTQEVQPEASPEPQQEVKPAAPKAKWTPKKKSTEPKPEADGDGW